MSQHSLFSPSSAHRWINCPGSMVYDQSSGSSSYADDGTASHEWAATCLVTGEAAIDFLGEKLTINGAVYEMDEERAGYVQVYLDTVRRLALGHKLFVEHWVDLSDYLGPNQGGTTDAGILEPEIITVVDLKYGMGEKVFAAHPNGQPNEQMGLYGLGLWLDALLLGYEPKKIRLVIVQPRLNHIDEAEFDTDAIAALGTRAATAVSVAGSVIAGTLPAEPWMKPAPKTCRWCRAQAKCPALAKTVMDEVRADFDTIAAEPPKVPTGTPELSRAWVALQMVQQWCKAVAASVAAAVSRGEPVIGSDGLPLKYVQGGEGDRKWANVEAAEAALLGILPPEKVYTKSVITAPAAAKLLNKKATGKQWKDQFVPLITRPPGKAVLALGSDPRPPFSGNAVADEFTDELGA